MIMEPKRVKTTISNTVSDDELLSYFQYKITEADKKLDILKIYAGDEKFDKAIGMIHLNTELYELSLSELEARYQILNITDKIVILWYIKTHIERIVKGLKNRIE